MLLEKGLLDLLDGTERRDTLQYLPVPGLVGVTETEQFPGAAAC